MGEATGLVLCFSIDQTIRGELLTKAHAHAESLGASLGIVIFGGTREEGLETLGRFGAEKVYVVSDPLLASVNTETYADALMQAIGELQPTLVLVEGSLQGLDITARAAQRLKASCINDLTGVERSGSGLTVKGMVLSGRGEATFSISQMPVFSTIVLQSPQLEKISDHAAEVVNLCVALDPPSVEVMEIRPKEVFDRGLERAEVIVDFGQGLADREDVKLIEQLAERLGGQIACTRPISSEREWLPDFIGLSGKRVAPSLCLSIGVAGAIQHMVGLRDAGIIVAINNDADAGIFPQSDFGIVGDLYAIVPALIEALEKRG